MTDDELGRAYDESLEQHPGRADCPDPDALRAVIERTGPEPERLAVLDHVMGCRPCRADFEVLRAFAAAAPREQRPWLPLLPALAAAALLTASLGVWRTLRPGSGVTRGDDGPVSLATPADAEIGPGGPLAWRPVPRTLRYLIEIRDEDGTLIVRDSVRDTTLAVPPVPDGIPAGALYWSVAARLEDGSEVRSRVRRIFFRRR